MTKKGSRREARTATRSPPRLILISDVARLGAARFLNVLDVSLQAGLPAVLLRERREAELLQLAAAVFDRMPPNAECWLHTGTLLPPQAEGRNAPAATATTAVTLSAAVTRCLEAMPWSGVHLPGRHLQHVETVREALEAIAASSRTESGRTESGRTESSRPRLGISAHSLAELRRAEAAGAHYAFYSPVFAPLSKSYERTPLGVDGFAAAASALAASRLDLYALGGMTPARTAPLCRAGATGVAVMGAILDADDPASATTQFIEALGAEPCGIDPTT